MAGKKYEGPRELRPHRKYSVRRRARSSAHEDPRPRPVMPRLARGQPEVRGPDGARLGRDAVGTGKMQRVLVTRRPTRPARRWRPAPTTRAATSTSSGSPRRTGSSSTRWSRRRT
jgi:hypothetical protein